MAQANLRKELRFVQVLDQGQLVGAASRELAFGSQLVFDEVNARGGLFGRKLALETIDNQGDPRKMAEVVGRLKQRDDIAYSATGTGKATVGTDPAAREDAIRRVKEFLSGK